MNMRKEFITIGPVPLAGLAAICSKLYRLGWDSRNVLYVGTMELSSQLALQKVPPQPVYAVLAEKMFAGNVPFDQEALKKALDAPADVPEVGGAA